MRTDHVFLGFGFKQALESLHKFLGAHDSLFAMLNPIAMQSEDLDKGYYLAPDEPDTRRNIIIRIVR
jgi:hypothetical protein